MEKEQDLPKGVAVRLKAYNDSLSDIEKVLEPAFEVPYSELTDKLSPLEKGKLDLVFAYTLNSLFWMYIQSKGENPRDAGVLTELGRVKNMMDRAKEITDKRTMPRLDKAAAKRFITHGLWAPKQVSKGNKRKHFDEEPEDEES